MIVIENDQDATYVVSYINLSFYLIFFLYFLHVLTFGWCRLPLTILHDYWQCSWILLFYFLFSCLSAFTLDRHRDRCPYTFRFALQINNINNNNNIRRRQQRQPTKTQNIQNTWNEKEQLVENAVQLAMAVAAVHRCVVGAATYQRWNVAVPNAIANLNGAVAYTVNCVQLKKG